MAVGKVVAGTRGDPIAAISETLHTTAATGSRRTIVNPLDATISRLTLSANCTLVFPTAIPGQSFTLVLVQDATGSRLVTWDAQVHWSGGTAPTLTTTAAKADYFSFVCTMADVWDGFTAGLNF